MPFFPAIREAHGACRWMHTHKRTTGLYLLAGCVLAFLLYYDPDEDTRTETTMDEQEGEYGSGGA